MEEIFVDIDGTDGFYKISNLGNVKSVRNNIILKPGVHKYGHSEDRKQIEKQLDNMKNNIDDYDNLDEEQKNRIIRECIRKVEVENDGLSKRGRIIEIYMIDGTKHIIHMTKKNHDFITNIIYKDKEKPLDDLQITARFIRKKKR